MCRAIIQHLHGAVVNVRLDRDVAAGDLQDWLSILCILRAKSSYSSTRLTTPARSLPSEGQPSLVSHATYLTMPCTSKLQAVR